jgi:DNA mismatch endonuclease (patch repair protein)
MSCIRGRGNKETEVTLMRLMRAQHITGWRRQVLLKFQIAGRKAQATGRKSQVSGLKSQVSAFRFQVRPDFVFARQRVAVFVDGCFWHGCRWHGTRPQGNAAFWARKLAGNRARDRRVNRVLRAHGWHVLRIWEHALRDADRVAQHLQSVIVNCELKKATAAAEKG